MKCPKCGYTSFESNNSCAKCGNELSDFREAYGLAPLVLPARLRASMAAEMAGADDDEENSPAESSNDMFSFDLPNHAEPVAPQPANDPFAYSEPAAPHDPFSELLETTSAAPAQKAAGGAGMEPDSFSWDETPVPQAAGAKPKSASATNVDDDFSSLFGEVDNSNK